MSSVTEVKQAPGRWEITLNRGTPREIIDALTPFGHIAVAPGKINVESVGDNLLTQARYVGVYRGGKVAGEDFQLTGSGMPFWLGDEDGKGPLIESVSASAATFAQAITAVLPDAIEPGTIYSTPGSMNHTFAWETSKSALNFIASGFATPTIPVSWRVNGDATLDAGPDSSMFNLNPTAILVKKGIVLRTGRGFDIIGLSGDLQLETMYNDYTTKVVVLGAGETGPVIAASASLAASAIPYSDMHGNPVAFTRLVDALDADEVSIAPALAASLLSRFDSPTYGATLSSDDYDVRGDLKVGDHVAAFDPDIGFVDYSHEMYYEGVPINPMFLQVIGLTWPIEAGFTVAFRTMTGTWWDLSDYYKPSGGQTLVDVGENPSGLTSLGFDIDRARVTSDSSTPATPVFGTFYTTHYLNDEGDTRAQILVAWTEPDNTDGSTITDGDHYEIRYRPNVTAPYAATWEEAAQDTWDELFTWMQPRVPPFPNDEWQVLNAPFDVEQMMVLELFASVVYEFQIRAVDSATPPNRSAWSVSKAFTAARDTLPPVQPAAPVVAGSRLSLQIIHYLGSSAGGTFNLDRDTQYLEVHVSGDPLFFPDATTLVGRLVVNAALAAQTPVVGTFAVEEVTERYVRVVAVDRNGNRSNASNTATATIELVDDAHISDLTVSKVTAGTISADWVNAGRITTGLSGQRLELNAVGLQAYDSDGSLTTNLSSDPDDSDQFIAFKSGDDVLAAVTDLGVITAQKVYAHELWLGGDSVLDKFVYQPPRGVVAFGFEGATDIQGRGANLFRGFIELAFTAETGRCYKITMQGDVESTSATAGERYLFRLFDGGTGIPTVDSASLGTVQQAATLNVGRNDTVIATWVFRCPDDIATGVHRLLWGFAATEGVGTLVGSADAYFYVEDVGPSDWFENNAVINDGGYKSFAAGGGISAVVPNPNPLRSVTTTFTADWHGTYGGGNDLMETREDIWQGDWLDENLRGLIGFPASMGTELTGATIFQAILTMYASDFKRSSGGTAVIGHHPYTSRPDTWANASVVQDVQREDDWPKIGSIGVILNSTMRAALAAGTLKGIAIGPAPDSSTIYSGHFDSEENSTRVPTLRVTYTK